MTYVAFVVNRFLMFHIGALSIPVTVSAAVVGRPAAVLFGPSLFAALAISYACLQRLPQWLSRALGIAANALALLGVFHPILLDWQAHGPSMGLLFAAVGVGSLLGVPLVQLLRGRMPPAFVWRWPSRIRVKNQFALGILPIGLMFAALLPAFAFGDWLMALLRLPPDTPAREHPNGTLWISLFVGALLFFMLLGYVLGWLANAAIARFLFRWPPDKVRALYLESGVPPHWLRSAASTAQVPGQQASLK